MVVNLENNQSFDELQGAVDKTLDGIDDPNAVSFPFLSENISDDENSESVEIVETPFFTQMASLWNRISSLNLKNIKYERIYGEHTGRVDYGGTFTYYWNTLKYSAHEDGDQRDPYLSFNGGPISLSGFNNEVEKLKDLVSKESKK